MPVKYAWPVCGNRSLRSGSASGGWFSIAVMARETARISPLRICEAHVSMAGAFKGGIRLLFLSEQLARNDESLDFASALADRAEFDVAIELFSRIVLDKTVAPMDLHAFVGHADGDFAGKEFGHAGFPRETSAVLIGEPCGLIDDQPCCFDLRRHISQLELNGLEFADGLAELFALLGVFDGGVERALGHAKCESGDGDSATV